MRRLLVALVALAALASGTQRAHAVTATVAFVSPVDGAAVQRGSVVQVSIDAEAPAGLAFVTVFAPGKASLANCTLTGTTTSALDSCDWTVPNGNKPQTLEAQVQDVAGTRVTTQITVTPTK